MKQFLTFVLLLVSACTGESNRCYDEHELSEAANRKLRSHYPQPAEPSPAAAADSSYTCPLELYLQKDLPPHLSGRSLSPWRYVTVFLGDCFPSSYTEAQCLCSGCILVPDSPQNQVLLTETHDYNSVPIKQSRVFLRKEVCADGKKHHLKPVTIQVAVGCTCVRPKTTS
ncbi:interleukin-17C [Takifugu flavidus]|uniref:interleukin-17C n=1 Tax=Takifugu flavidus TaxID=433684 RepID=UPI0025445D74|nr:interleukin-17C [Takifugu flavidus]